MIDLKEIEDVNLRSDILKQNLIEQLQEAKLPIVIIKYIMQDLTRQVEQQFYTHCSKVGLSTQNKESRESQAEVIQQQD